MRTAFLSPLSTYFLTAEGGGSLIDSVTVSEEASRRKKEEETCRDGNLVLIQSIYKLIKTRSGKAMKEDFLKEKISYIAVPYMYSI